MKGNAFCGTLRDCLLHLGEARGVVSTSRVLVQAIGVEQHTASQWLRGIREPQGHKRIKLVYWLEGEGFQLKELDKLQPEVKQLGRLLAEDKLTPEEMREELQYNAPLQTLWQMLRGNSRLVGPRLARAREVVARYQGNRSAHSQDLVSEPEMDHRQILWVLAQLVKSAKPLAEIVESDLFTEAEREALRQLVGEEDFFEFANILNRLGGPRARSLYRGEAFNNGNP